MIAVGEKVYLAKHGTGNDEYFLPMVAVTEDELKAWSAQLKPPPTAISMGQRKLLPLQLETGAAPGTLEARLYDPTVNGWTATVAISRFK